MVWVPVMVTREIVHGEGKKKTIEIIEYLSDYRLQVFQIGQKEILFTQEFEYKSICFLPVINEGHRIEGT